MFPISTSQPGPLHSLSPCGSIFGQSAGINNPVHLCTSEGCDSESLCQVYFDIDRRPHTAATGPWDADGAETSSSCPVPWMEVQEMDSSSQMASQYIVTGCGQRRAHSQCHHVEGCGHCSGLNDVSLKFIPLEPHNASPAYLEAGSLQMQLH